MGKIYGTPKSIELPKYNWSKDSREETQAKEDKFLNELKEFLQKTQSNSCACAECGEIIQFQVADGYAKYMVCSLSPVALVHIPLDDAWEYPLAHRLTAKDIRAQIQYQNSMKKFFSKA